ncbi:gliding motility-associated C-terminal domain-containing protein [Flavobacteriaceae bacterium]|nr:gliding motility-associated C-terminal domain-containing protein [Flavobacteriaceae bacterium]MDB9888812.1 gliding motility-associated C-terminal domain-containing protein [Flavobacteriaceae bacterium]MDO7629097.1 gliding motility-associated C-terminal domain-containing protein [Flavobacteriaceae bacterium]
MPFKKYISKPTILLVVGGFFSGQFLRSQEVTVFHESVSIGSLNSFAVFGTTLMVKKSHGYIHTLHFSGLKKQTLELVHAQDIKNLFIYRSKGIEIIGVLRLSNTLVLNGPIIVNEQREGLIEFGIDALIQNNLPPYFIQGWVGIKNKNEFIFPIGSDKKFMPIGVNSAGSIKKNTTGLSLQIKTTVGQANRKFGNTYSTENYLSRAGISEMDTNHYWEVQSEAAQYIQIEWPSAQAFYTDLNVQHKGIAAWNKSTQNWQILPLEIKTRTTSIDTETAIGTSFQSRLKTLPFKVSDFSKWVLCDCRVKDPEYKALGNFLLTLNEDQINNSINLSQYPRSRLVNFQLYDRYGVMLFKLKSMDPKSLKDRIKNNTSYTGTYFYIVHLKAPKQIEQGYIYLIKK